jgi:hypothetical protein
MEAGMNHIEDDIQKAAFDQYAARGTSGSVLFAVPNGGARDKKEAARLKGQGVTPGAPDMFCAAFGEACWIELKAPKGRVSPAQEAMHRRIKGACGMDTYIVYGLDALLELLERRGVLRANRSFIAA